MNKADQKQCHGIGEAKKLASEQLFSVQIAKSDFALQSFG
jgi:hypothetical protein